MKLVTLCPNCKRKNTLKQKATDRYKLSLKVGESFDLKCRSCLVSNHFSVNDVSAESGFIKLISFLASLAIIAIGFLLLRQYFLISTWWLVPMLIGIPVSFYAALSKEENNRIRAFNRYKCYE